MVRQKRLIVQDVRDTPVDPPRRRAAPPSSGTTVVALPALDDEVELTGLVRTLPLGVTGRLLPLDQLGETERLLARDLLGETGRLLAVDLGDTGRLPVTSVRGCGGSGGAAAVISWWGWQ